MTQLKKFKIYITIFILISFSFTVPFDKGKNNNFFYPPYDYLSLKGADSLLRNLNIDYSSDKDLWFRQVNTLKQLNYVLDYFKPSNYTPESIGVYNDSLVLLNVGGSPVSKLILSSSLKKVKLTPTSPITTNNLAISVYMETMDLSIYNNWVSDNSFYAFRPRSKNQVTPFEETWFINYDEHIFHNYSITFKILNETKSDRIVSIKPIVYSVELRRSYWR